MEKLGRDLSWFIIIKICVPDLFWGQGDNPKKKKDAKKGTKKDPTQKQGGKNPQQTARRYFR